MARFFAVSGPAEIRGYNWAFVKTKLSALASVVPHCDLTKGGKGKAAVRTLCDGLQLTAEGEAAHGHQKPHRKKKHRRPKAEPLVPTELAMAVLKAPGE